jgi:hypothetical protein
MSNYFCSEKFTWLSVDLEKKTNRSCCAAQPHNIDLKWLTTNPGHLFNTPELINERKMMLDNQPVATCEDVCWRTESRGMVSRRQQLGLDTLQILPVLSSPNCLHVIIVKSIVMHGIETSKPMENTLIILDLTSSIKIKY